MRRRSNPALFLVPLMLATTGSSAARAQEGTWTFVASAGAGFVGMEDVNRTLERTVRFWNEVEFIPVGPFSKFSVVPSFGFRTSYRYDRDVAVSLSASFFSAKVRNHYSDPSVELDMERSVGSVDLLLGLSYFFPLEWSLELQTFVDAGVIFARADALTFNSRVEKTGPDVVTTVYYDTDAKYRGTKAVATFGSSLTWSALSPFVLRTELSYRFARIGEMKGTIRKTQGTFEDLSQTVFDFSVLSVNLGIGYQFE
ncbi:MAG: hypothetical protein HYW57_04525 [Ignavibacteriales bacterium]|nr:hypothetical protein [Ignavibacteriales bacterium]